MKFILLNHSPSQVQQSAFKLLVVHLIHYIVMLLMQYVSLERYQRIIMEINPKVGSLRRGELLGEE